MNQNQGVGRPCGVVLEAVTGCDCDLKPSTSNQA